VIVEQVLLVPLGSAVWVSILHSKSFMSGVNIFGGSEPAFELLVLWVLDVQRQDAHLIK